MVGSITRKLPSKDGRNATIAALYPISKNNRLAIRMADPYLPLTTPDA
jgi:hypothetical protein